ncbi:HAD family hydrolase [Corynebacterium auriscanis]|uniref:HAD family hydrolase n=1 Tax=Corynebacterium auriscanis TaxID=99807 RepID=UPI0025B323BC|nr:HAD-IB family hydrolase [Corynebacterium auriscanis]WJY73641.1 Phosphoserine phosphatase [Corynebacterium auriscanis]
MKFEPRHLYTAAVAQYERTEQSAGRIARAINGRAQGVYREILSRRVFPARGESAQREAGEASAKIALQPTVTETDDRLGHAAWKHSVTREQLQGGIANVEGAAAAARGRHHLNVPDPNIPQDPGAAAFFDVDNTLIRGASILLFARGLAKRRFFTIGQIVGFAWKQLKFQLVGEENAGDISEGRDQALGFVKGREESEVVALAEEIWAATIAERIFPGTRELADMHLQAGQQVWLVSATPVQLAQVIARELGFTGALGTVSEVKDGKFTGRMVGDLLHGPGKKYAVAALAEREGLDLQRCTAYSDSVNDVPLLSMVGTAVTVNPDSALRSEAKKRGWEVRDYRRRKRAWQRVRNSASSAKSSAKYAGNRARIEALQLRGRRR